MHFFSVASGGEKTEGKTEMKMKIGYDWSLIRHGEWSPQFSFSAFRSQVLARLWIFAPLLLANWFNILPFVFRNISRKNVITM